MRNLHKQRHHCRNCDWAALHNLLVDGRKRGVKLLALHGASRCCDCGQDGNLYMTPTAKECRGRYGKLDVPSKVTFGILMRHKWCQLTLTLESWTHDYWSSVDLNTSLDICVYHGVFTYWAWGSEEKFGRKTFIASTSSVRKPKKFQHHHQVYHFVENRGERRTVLKLSCAICLLVLLLPSAEISKLPRQVHYATNHRSSAEPIEVGSWEEPGTPDRMSHEDSYREGFRNIVSLGFLETEGVLTGVAKYGMSAMHFWK